MSNFEIIGITMNGIKVYDSTSIGGHIHNDVKIHAQKAISMIKLDPGCTYSRIMGFDIGEKVGLNHLVKTDEDSVITYMIRKNRHGESRFVLNKNAEETSILNMIFCKETQGENAGTWFLWTFFAGDEGEREPWDASLKTEEERAKANAFWACHALVPTEEERRMIEGA